MYLANAAQQIIPDDLLYNEWMSRNYVIVVDLVRRFDKIARRKTLFWLLFSQGLFSPIVGGLSAVVIVSFVQAGLIDLLKPIPPTVVAFFAGFSEQLLDKIGTYVTPD